MKSPWAIPNDPRIAGHQPSADGDSADCGHDGWQAGCPNCEQEHALALSLIGDDVALD